MDNYMVREDIDVVFCWVDGSDPTLVEKRRKFGLKELNTNFSATRFADCGELLYSLAAVLKFMTFVRNVYVVTDDQVPTAIEKLKDHLPSGILEKIKIVDHREIFRDYVEFLPTFNSRSIETMLHRIPGIASRYIYFNDDFILTKPISEGDFFNGGGLIARGNYRATWPIYVRKFARSFVNYFGFNTSLNRVSEKEKQVNSARLLGIRGRYFWHDHTPHPFYRKVLEDFFGEHPMYLEANARHRVRSHSQFGIPSLSYCLCLERKVAAIEDTSLVYMSPVGKKRPAKYVMRKLRDAESKRVKFLCVQNLDILDENVREIVFLWIHARVFGNSERLCE